MQHIVKQVEIVPQLVRTRCDFQCLTSIRTKCDFLIYNLNLR